MSRLRRLALAAAGIAISVLCLFVLTQLVDLSATLVLLGQTAPLPVVLGVGVVAIQFGLRSVRWSWLLPTPGNSRIPPRRLVPVLLVGYLGNILLPARLGELVRAYLVARRESVPISSSLGSVLLERLLDLASLAVVGWVAAMVGGAPDWIVNGTAIVAAIGFGLTAILVIVGVGRIATWAERSIGRGSLLAKRLTEVLVRFGQGAGGQPRRAIALALTVSAACWLLDGTTFWLMAQATGTDIAWASCLLIAAVTVLGTAIPSAPGYIGTFELAAVGAGVALGLPTESVLAMAVLAHAVTTVPLAVGGAISLAGMSLSMGSVAAAASSAKRDAR